MAKKIRLINRSTGFDSEKEKAVRLINPSTGFDSRNPATYGRDYEAEQKKETERANAKLAVRRAPKALSSRGSAGIAQMADRGMGNMSNLGRARNFEEYMQLRKEEEEAQGMQRAAEKLLAQNNTGTDVMFGKTDREREEEAQAAADLREMQYGYKRLGDKAVFATPFSPLPADYKTKAQVPSAFGISDQEYVEAALACGTSSLRILYRHIIPNAIGPIIVQATLDLSATLLAISGLSYIGLGVSSPIPEWGLMLSEGTTYMFEQPHLVLVPGITLVIVAMAANLFGDGLRDALDPKLKN